MYYKAICIYLCLLVIDAVFGRHARIIGGHPTTIAEYPFLVSFRLAPYNLHFCAGSIVSHWHVLSAGHCFLRFGCHFQDVRVFTSTSSSTNTSGPVYTVQEIITHHDFPRVVVVNSVTPHDLAIIKLDRYMHFNNHQTKINLPTRDIAIGDIGFLAGWGLTSFPNGLLSENLQLVATRIMSKDECQPTFPGEIHESQICAYQAIGVGACAGDSGGPLISNNELYGVISFSYRCAEGIPDINTKIYDYVDFIRFHIEGY